MRMMGSKKKPILPINLDDTVGREIEKTSLIVCLSGEMSVFLIVKFLGVKKRKVVILTISVMMLNKINPITARKTDLLISSGNTKIINRIFINCSNIFEIVFGIIL